MNKMRTSHSLCLAQLCPALLLSSFLIACGNLPSQSVKAEDAAAASKQYDKIMSLEGDWYLVGEEQEQPFVTYEISSAGNSVVEKLFAGQEQEMTTIYYMEDGALSMAHYCSIGNRPHMTAVPSQDEDIVFELVRVENMANVNDLHISGLWIEFFNENEMTAHWSSTQDQKLNEMATDFRVMRRP
jgi:hypothetical protein